LLSNHSLSSFSSDLIIELPHYSSDHISRIIQQRFRELFDSISSSVIASLSSSSASITSKQEEEIAFLRKVLIDDIIHWINDTVLLILLADGLGRSSIDSLFCIIYSLFLKIYYYSYHEVVKEMIELVLLETASVSLATKKEEKKETGKVKDKKTSFKSYLLSLNIHYIDFLNDRKEKVKKDQIRNVFLKDILQRSMILDMDFNRDNTGKEGENRRVSLQTVIKGRLSESLTFFVISLFSREFSFLFLFPCLLFSRQILVRYFQEDYVI
jgi:hypothetical protein